MAYMEHSVTPLKWGAWEMFGGHIGQKGVQNYKKKNVHEGNMTLV